jgi:bifunctional NMN adenylyltransferase/nudix hydrolase
MPYTQLFDFLVFIGRFQPFHMGHAYVVQNALRQAKKVIILCGSAFQPRSIRNPWNETEREEMIRNCFSSEENTRLIILPVIDVIYNTALWVQNVQSTVNKVIEAEMLPKVKVGLIGHSKDNTSYYLNLFPKWFSTNVDNYGNINASDIRDDLFHYKDVTKKVKEIVPQAVYKYLEGFCKQPPFASLCEEYIFVKNEQLKWQNAPYPPIFITADALVLCGEYVLMIRRKNMPGRGLLALPGGYINYQEKLFDGCLRELYEETNIDLTKEELRNMLIVRKLYDEPLRSVRGRIITEVFLFQCKESKLPMVRAEDDALEAIWVALNKLDPREIFEDHYYIIQDLRNFI